MVYMKQGVYQVTPYQLPIRVYTNGNRRFYINNIPPGTIHKHPDIKGLFDLPVSPIPSKGSNRIYTYKIRAGETITKQQCEMVKDYINLILGL